MAQYLGKVMWFNNAKGFGFLSRESAPDVFVHFSAIVKDGYKSLAEGNEVSLDLVQGDKGPQANDVRLVESRGGTHPASSVTQAVGQQALATP